MGHILASSLKVIANSWAVTEYAKNSVVGHILPPYTPSTIRGRETALPGQTLNYTHREWRFPSLDRDVRNLYSLHTTGRRFRNSKNILRVWVSRQCCGSVARYAKCLLCSSHSSGSNRSLVVGYSCVRWRRIICWQWSSDMWTFWGHCVFNLFLEVCEFCLEYS